MGQKGNTVLKIERIGKLIKDKMLKKCKFFGFNGEGNMCQRSRDRPKTGQQFPAKWRVNRWLCSNFPPLNLDSLQYMVPHLQRHATEPLFNSKLTLCV